MKKKIKTKKVPAGSPAPSPLPAPAKSRQAAALPLLLLLAVVTFMVYTPSLRNELTNWDDDRYVLQNQYLGNPPQEPLVNVFTGFFQGNYHPLTLLSLRCDYALGGFSPFPYHLVNLLLHVVNTLLVFRFLLLIAGSMPVAFAAALLFGVHTLHVESVAWVSERKDLLYAAFFLGSLILYGKFIKSGRKAPYAASLALFLLCLLSKGQGVALPLVLVALEWFMRKKPLAPGAMLRKTPFFILAATFGVVAIFAQKTGGAIKDVAYIYRIPVACYGYAQYLLKLILPVHLSAMYPYPFQATGAIPMVWFLASLAGVSAVTFFFLRSLKKGDHETAFSIGFFTVSIMFVLQILPVGRAIIADRYAYLPSIGYCLVIGRSSRFFATAVRKRFWYAGFGIYAALLCILTWQRCGVWHDSYTLWSDTIEKEPTAFEAYANRGLARMNFYKDYEGAIKDCSVSLQFVQQNAPALTCRGIALYQKAQNTANPAEKRSLLAAAAADLRASFAIIPDQPNEQLCLGSCDIDLGNVQQAILDFKQVLALHPNNAIAYTKIGYCFFQLNQPDSVIAYCSKAIALNPSDAYAYGNMGLAYQQKTLYPQAADCYEKAINLDPKIDKAYVSNLVGICNFLRQPERANRYIPLLR